MKKAKKLREILNNKINYINMIFKIPIKIEKEFVSDKLYFDINCEYHKVISKNYIKKGELLLIEYPKINLFGEKEIDKALQLMKLYNDKSESELYPRNDDFYKSPMIKNIHKIISNSDIKLQNYFNKLTKSQIEKLYAKYLYNTFEGWEYGPLTLPLTAKFNHSCDPNIEYKFDKESGTMKVFALKNIKNNSELFDCYLSNKSIDNHSEYLFQHYGFNCSCKM
jgi:hypothetical protein